MKVMEMMTLNDWINEIEDSVSKAKIYGNEFVEKRNTQLLALLLELREHRKAFGIDELLERED